MNKPDFDFSKCVQVPDQWIENALNIPNTAHEQPKIISYPHRFAVAASVVLVTVLGISIFFFFGNKKPIPIRSNSGGTATAAPTEIESTDALPCETVAESGNTESTLSPGVKTEVETQIATDSRGRVIVIPGSTQIVRPSAPQSTESGHSVPTDASTQAHEPCPTDVPKQQPTQKPAVTPTAPPSPTYTKPAPTSAPATAQPTDTATEEQKRRADIRVPLSKFECIEVASDDNSGIYCRVYDSHGHMLGDSDPFAPSHIVDVEPGEETDENYAGPVYSYSFEYLTSQVSGTLRFEFYTKNNGSGNVIYTGTVTL